ncbi:MAG: hypothetical protein D6679_00065 [Candidatus Hydrogenedentota bacterium]|nr:MAG: hypothetical protein D6679_00065 [Candidatus Hydrogenedentota bacterium]
MKFRKVQVKPQKAEKPESRSHVPLRHAFLPLSVCPFSPGFSIQQVALGYAPRFPLLAPPAYAEGSSLRCHSVCSVVSHCFREFRVFGGFRGGVREKAAEKGAFSGED